MVAITGFTRVDKVRTQKSAICRLIGPLDEFRDALHDWELLHKSSIVEIGSHASERFDGYKPLLPVTRKIRQ
jgi:hypothetical protein